MSKSIGVKTLTFNKNIVYFLYPIVIVTAKILRYTVLRNMWESTTGFSMLPQVLNGTNSVVIFDNSASTNNAIIFFKLFNVFHLRTYFQFEMAVTIVYSLIIFLLLMRAKRTFTLYQLILTLAMVGILNIFSLTLNKEPVQMLFYFVMYFVILSPRLSQRQKDVCLLLIWFLSAALFRTYYIMAVGFYVLMRIATTVLQPQGDKKLSTIKIVLIFILMAAAYFCLLLFTRRFSPNAYTQLLHARAFERTGYRDDVNTRIVPWVSSSELINYPLIYLTTSIRLLFPLELLQLVPQSPKYLIYVVYQLMVTGIVLQGLRNFKTNPPYKNTALCVYLSYLFTAAAAESDFGTWVRHETTLFPILFIILLSRELCACVSPIRKRRNHYGQD